MALEATFRTLSVQIRRLSDVLVAVQLTVGDRPAEPGAALADGIENNVLDMLGRLEEARNAARAAEKAVAPPVDMDRARRALTQCQEALQLAAQQFANGLAHYEKMRSLAILGRERGGEWKAWAGSMGDAINECREPLEAADRALAACWPELVEHSGNTSISIRNRSVGQKIHANELGEPT